MKKANVSPTVSTPTTYVHAAQHHRDCQEECYREAILEVDASINTMIKQFTVAGEYSQLQVLEGMLKDYLKDITRFKTVIACSFLDTDVELDPKAANQIAAFKQFAAKANQQPAPQQPQQKVRG